MKESNGANPVPAQTKITGILLKNNSLLFIFWKL